MNKNKKDLSSKSISNIALLLTEDCNFRCEYCFIKKNPSKIDWETIIDTLDWLSDQNSKNERLSVNFFGGEPMLEYDLIKKTVLYADKEYKDDFKFSITTNGSLFNEEKLDFFEKHNISVLFSIDGPEHVHNIHRKTTDGSDSFHQVEWAMKEVVKRGLGNVARPTYTPDTLPYLFETVKYLLEDVGFKTASPTPATDGFKQFSEEDYKEYDRQFDKIDKYFKDRVLRGESAGINYYQKCFRQELSDASMKAPCGAGKKYVAVNHAGDIFPCHRFVQWPEWKIGNVKSGITEKDLRSIFANFENDKTDPKCAKCDNKFCGGGCFASNYSQTGSIYKTSDMACELSKRQWDRSMEVLNELKNEPKFQSQFSNLINRASKETKNKLGIKENKKSSCNSSKNHSNKHKNRTVQKSNQIKTLEQRVLKLEQTVQSLSQVVLDLVEGGE